jgi:hypothetical protein
MSNWDFDSLEAAVEAFRHRAEERLSHGYELRESRLPDSEAQRAA